MRKLAWRDLCSRGEAFHAAFVSRSEEGSWEIHGHDFCEVFWIDSGAGRHLLPDGQQDLKAGSLGFIRPWDCHGFLACASSEPFTMINVAFPESEWHGLRQRYPLDLSPIFHATRAHPPLQELGGSPARTAARLFREILHLPRTGLARDAFLLSLATLLQLPDPLEGLASAPAWLRRSLLTFSRDPERLRGGPRALARFSGCSGGHLSRTMRQVLGLTPSFWINQQRLRRAAQLLESTGLSVSEVALESGFENLSHFHHRFLLSYGHTPLRHRRLHSRTIV